ncbi:MAG: site-specific integrase [Candidatus Bathyarchaeia archaeon]
MESLLMDYVTDHRNLDGKVPAGSYLHSTVKAVRSWLSANDIELRHKIKIRGDDDTPTLKDERIPSKEELRRILLSATKQSRVAVAMMAFAGVRPGVLGDYKGQDGLRVEDFPELDVTPSKIGFEKTPAMVVVRASLSKGGHQYFSFIGDEPCGYVVDYLNERRSRFGEDIRTDSPIIRPKFTPSERSDKDTLLRDFVRTTNVGDMIRCSIRRAGFGWRPYVLRCYFDTQLLLAESKGALVRDFRSFFMGHSGDIENRYTTNKHRLPQDLVEDMRRSYLRSQSFLQTIEPETREDDLKLMFKRELLLISGFAEDEITKLDLRTINDGKLHLLMKHRLLGVMNGNRQQGQKVH